MSHYFFTSWLVALTQGPQGKGTAHSHGHPQKTVQGAPWGHWDHHPCASPHTWREAHREADYSELWLATTLKAKGGKELLYQLLPFPRHHLWKQNLWRNRWLKIKMKILILAPTIYCTNTKMLSLLSSNSKSNREMTDNEGFLQSTHP